MDEKMPLPFKKIRVVLTAFVAGSVFAISGCQQMRDGKAEQARPEAPRPEASFHLFFGNPSNAGEGDPNNYLIVGDGSVVSYNNSSGTANWVSWRTTKSDLGPSLKRPDFRPDPRLPAWFQRINSSDYSGSGYDRGHLVPSADRFGNVGLNEETFLMTNIVPQTPALNQYPWEKLESFARGQARRGFDVYQIAGVHGVKGTLNGKVAVPASCWKVIIVMPRGRTEVADRVSSIAVDMPNENGIEQGGWERFRTSIRAIEEKTGYDLFGSLPREIQDRVETTVETTSY